jgi:FKBP-type peptidyl-prolyl cis-trans isomerase
MFALTRVPDPKESFVSTRSLPAVLAASFLLALAGCGSDTPSAPDNSGGVTTLQVTDITVGTGATAVNGDVLTVNYVGTFLDGRQFDAGSFTFQLGAGRVIPGFDQGLVGMKVGGKRQLVIPPSLAYGSAGSGSIPPNTTLKFVVDLLSIQGK